MANAEQLAILKQGVEMWNKWCYDNQGIDIDLSDADLSRTNLRGVFSVVLISLEPSLTELTSEQPFSLGQISEKPISLMPI